MNAEFFKALEQLEAEKGIPKEYMIEKIEAALVSAYKREQGGSSNVRVFIDPAKKDVRVFQLREVVDNDFEEYNEINYIYLEEAKKLSKRYKLGSVVEVELKTKNFRRLSAQTAKQVIIQGIREAERGMIIKEYEDKKEEIITATVQRIDPQNGNVLVDTGTSIATLLKSEQIPGETFVVGQHIKVFVTEVSKDSLKGPIVTLSRTHSHMVKRMFENDIPEIQSGTVVIKAITREAGSRVKMAVWSRDESVDPIGACIGSHGSRIQNVINELGGEKIDIIMYSESPEEFIANALAPAVVREVVIDGEKICHVIVDSDQLSLAIGKSGQNARLAARLTGFKIDIRVE
ncbi:MAG: transcription termination/antitermination protein NusA [Clostridia bacterium]|jgi:N utilization substance protein A|nr:transcription termination/antitermination protein NusA [Clostridia bacterium]MBQ5601964.1 transcription termination/antitermination protein NusA [Clostridia bacterium]